MLFGLLRYGMARSSQKNHHHNAKTPSSMNLRINNCRADIVPVDFIQSETTPRGIASSTFININQLMGEILSYIVK
jgi:hypothetical protein